MISYVGMESQEVTAQSIMNVILKSSSQALDEVVVIAYGTQSARTVTSAVSSVRADAIKDVPSVSFDQMLQGRASGVSITTPSAGVGQPPVVRIRGVNSITSGTSPLYVVDGIPIQSGNISTSGDLGSLGTANALADINPADIISMDVLKDASAAALYGSRAANGVIMITTRQGSRGGLKVNYDGFVGFSNPTNFYDMMNAQQYVEFKNMSVKNLYGTDEMVLPGGVATEWGNKAFNLMKDSKGNIIDSNWRDAVFQNGISQSQTVSISGGSEKIIFYSSLNYTTQEGIVKGDKYNRLGFKTNVSAQATDWLKLGLNTNVTTGTTEYTDAARLGSNFATGGFPRLALINTPNIPIWNEDGTAYYDKTASGLGYGPNTVRNTFSNPERLLEMKNGIGLDVNRLIGSMFAEISPIEGLVLRTQYGIDYSRVEERRFWGPGHGDGYNSQGLANAYAVKNNVWTLTNTATYDFSLGNNNFNVLLGQEANERNWSRWTAQRTTLQDPNFTVFQGPFLNATAGGGISNNSLVSYFGRINYDFDSKYMISVNYRRDGYSAVSKDNRWGNFGGVSAAWRLSSESFFSGLTHIFDDVKIKGSYGRVGNTNIADYAAKSYYSSYYYGTSGTYWLGQVADQNLKWETSTKYDIGLSAQLLNRINVDIDYYHTKSSDLILEVPQSPSKGIPGNVIITNAGAMKNSGIELTVSADVIRSKDFTWNTNFNITTNKNKVTALADGVTEIIGQDDSGLEPSNLTVVGKSIGQLYVVKTGGIDRETGRRVFYMQDKQNKDIPVRTLYNAVDRVYMADDGTTYTTAEFYKELAGGSLPTYYGGWNNNFRYKSFDLTIFFQFSGGNKILNGTKATVSDMRYWNNSVDVWDNYWRADRKDAEYAHPVYGDNVSNGSANPISDWIEKGDYLRLKNVSLGYTFDTKRWPKAIGITGLRIYAQAQNLFVITGYSGMDPEALTNVVSPTLAGGTDKNTMPQARTYTFGMNLTF